MLASLGAWQVRSHHVTISTRDREMILFALSVVHALNAWIGQPSLQVVQWCFYQLHNFLSKGESDSSFDLFRSF